MWRSVLIEGANCRELIDNVVDMAHFFYVHYNQPVRFHNVFEGNVATQDMAFKPRADMRGTTEFLDFGAEAITDSVVT